jgi:hypothetical protein
MFLRRYWPLIPIAVVFAAAVSQEWSNKNTPQPPLNAAAPQIPARAASLPAPQQPNSTIQNASTPKPENESIQDIAAQTVAEYTEALAWFTFILAAASIGNGIFLIRADKAAARAYNASSAATKVSQDLAEKQFLLEGRRADLAEKQHGLLRLQFLATNRPELVIREVFWTKLLADGTDVVSFTLINRGQSRGRVVEGAIEVRSDNPIVQLTTDGKNGLGDITLVAGEFIFRQVIADQFLAGARGMVESYLRGVIIYEDDAGIRRRLVVCRRAPMGNDRFLPLMDPEYEYTD